MQNDDATEESQPAASPQSESAAGTAAGTIETESGSLAGSAGGRRNTEGSGTTETTTEDVTDPDLDALKFGANVSLRYHAARRAFFDGLHRFVMAAAAIGGSAAFVAVVGGQTGVAKLATFVLATAAALDVAFGFSEKARHHDYLYRRWADLVVEMIRHGPPIPEVLRGWLAERTLIEKEEPTPLDALNVVCHNIEAEVQRYGDESIYHVRWYQHLFRHFTTLPPNQFSAQNEWKKWTGIKGVFTSISVYVVIALAWGLLDLGRNFEEGLKEADAFMDATWTGLLWPAEVARVVLLLFE